MSSPHARSRGARGSPSQSQSRPSTRNGKLSREYSEGCDQIPQVITELAQLLVDRDDRFNQQLDAASQQQKVLHVQSLADSLRKHDAVRKSAERVQQQIQYELQAEQVRRDQEEARKLAEAKEKLAAEQGAQLKRLEEDRRKDEERKQQEARLQRERDEAAQRLKEEDEKKARHKSAQEKEAADRKEAQRQAAQQQQAEADQAKQRRDQQQQELNAKTQQTKTQGSSPSQVPTSGPQAVSGQPSLLVSSPEQRDREHQAYLTMKQELKKSVATLDAAKQNDAWLKEHLGEHCRRRIRVLLGQVNKKDKAENKRVISEIQRILDDARVRYPTETLDISPFFLGGNPDPTQSPQFPLLLFDLLNHFAKAVINQIATEAAIDRASAEPIGIVAATIFSNPNNSFHGHSLITILWARYHQRCPVLFGVWGDERDKAGRSKMGWKLNSERQHRELTKGLASGFAAITLRDFSHNRNTNPAPNRLFWECVARILNTKDNKRSPTHFVALESLLDPIFIPRFIKFYGQAAIAVLRLATGEFTRIPPGRDHVAVAAKVMDTLKAKLSIELNIWL